MTTALAVADSPKIGRPLLYSTPEAMQEAIDAYFKAQDEAKLPYTMSGLARALDTSRKVIIEYEGRDGFSNAVKRARARVEEQLEVGLISRNTQVAGHIFNLKNNFGWKDTQEIEHTHMLLAVGQPGSSLPQLEPPVIEVSPLPDIEPEAKVAQIIEENPSASHNRDSVNQAKALTVQEIGQTGVVMAKAGEGVARRGKAKGAPGGRRRGPQKPKDSAGKKA